MLQHFFRPLMRAAVLVTLLTLPQLAHSQDNVSTAPMPRVNAAPIRIIPVAGASSFATSDTVKLDRFDKATTLGLFADFGDRTWVFETGVLALTSNVGSSSTDNTSI